MPDQPQIPEAAKSAAYEALGIGDNPRLKRESAAARINERTRVDVALEAALPAILQANDAEVKLAEVEEQSVARGDRVIEIERRLVEARSKATDAAKFAEREYERVCEERDRFNKQADELADDAVQAEAKLAQVRVTISWLREEAAKYRRMEAECKADEKRDRESGKLKPRHSYEATWNYYQGLWKAKANAADRLRSASNDSDSTEVDNG